MKAIKKLKKLSTHASSNVQLAAWQSLFLLGDTSFAEKIAQEALNENLFAIALLASKPGYEDLLLKLCKSSNLSVRFNAAYALLQRKDPRVLPFLPEFLVRDSRDLGFLPAISVGNSLRAWKVISSTLQHAENSHFDLHALTLALKEQLLAGAIELEESSFLHLAKAILVAKQNELIPMLAQLLENLQTPSAIALLKQGSELPGAPLIRTYCHLTLYRLNQEGPHKQAVLEFLQKSESHELIRFRNTLPLNVRLSESTYHLTPEESSTLLIRAYQTLSEKQNIESIDILLDAISHSTLHNRPVLAAILLRTLH
jgi:HEAT repeat protein